MMCSSGMMTSRALLLAATACHLIILGSAGPLPNVTSTDAGLKSGSCALGDVVYMPGDQLPGADPCERCVCSAGELQCVRQRCDPRPGCKAVHRPDHCCPTYQCECEQEGRVYGNGEKLVDPQDPCRVCYCQGGEVVCRRIACFVRDDCRPRLVPGRCCPEYDNCPLRGVSTLPGVSPFMSSTPAIEDVGTTASPFSTLEKVKQEITIKEITPVSEIPVITDVKIKEIVPSPNNEVNEFPSSKSPLIPREATTDKSISRDEDLKSDIAVSPSSSSLPTSVVMSSTFSSEIDPKTTVYSEIKNAEDLSPSKISFSTQDSINSDIYPENITDATAINILSSSTSATTKAPMIEEEDPTMFDHNPAFPPLPDDLSVMSNHEDESVPDTNMENEHHEQSSGQETSTISISTSEPVAVKEVFTTTSTTELESRFMSSKTPVMLIESQKPKENDTNFTESTATKANPMLNLRSAIPIEILSVPSSVPEVITGELDDEEEMTSTTLRDHEAVVTSTTTEWPKKEDFSIDSDKLTKDLSTLITNSPQNVLTTLSSTSQMLLDFTTEGVVSESSSYQNRHEQTTSELPKSNIATEVTSQTELSSLPVETSDQNPPSNSDSTEKEKVISTEGPSSTPVRLVPTEAEFITVTLSSSTEKEAFDTVETTEFVFTSAGSSENPTDSVELIKVSSETDRSSAIIEATNGRKNNVLTDLINLVGDVASISNHTESSVSQHNTASTLIPESEELMPVNVGYKSKNKNVNSNSITEIPTKNKISSGPNKMKVIEIEGDDTESITDSQPPFDKIEPTTKRPIIDNVSDNVQRNETEKTDIEILTKSYVPTISRRPTKVVMKKNSDKVVSEEKTTSPSEEVVTEDIVTSSESITSGYGVISEEAGERMKKTNAKNTSAEQ